MAAQFTYTVDGVDQHTSEHELTPRAILTAAGLDAAQRYLIEVRGKEQFSFKDKMDTPVHINEKATFVTASLGPTGVS